MATKKEVDFFRAELGRSDFEKRRPVRGIQRTISMVNPEMLKSVLASRSMETMGELGKMMPESRTNCFSNVSSAPVINPVFRRCYTFERSPAVTAPMTIFYNGNVCAFDVTADKAEKIIQFAAGAIINYSHLDSPPAAADQSIYQRQSQQLAGMINQELPIARKRSLMNFLEKRKKRLTAVWPYCKSTPEQMDSKNKKVVDVAVAVPSL